MIQEQGTRNREQGTKEQGNQGIRAGEQLSGIERQIYEFFVLRLYFIVPFRKN